MEIHELKGQIRTATGKSATHALKRDNMVPAVLYGPKIEPLSLSIGAHDVELLIKKSLGSTMMVNLSIDGASPEKRLTMIKEVQSHPVSRSLYHVDFYEVDPKKKIKVLVQVNTIGQCPGVEQGGMLQTVRRELEVLCLPMKVPASIDIDVTNLEIGDAVHVEDLELGENIEIPTDVNFTVVTVLSPTKPEVEETDEEEMDEEGEGAEETAEEGQSEE